MASMAYKFGCPQSQQSRLLVAIHANDANAAKQVLEQGLDPDVRFHTGFKQKPAICLCAERGSVQLVNVLLKCGCSVNQTDSSGLSALHIAAKHGHINIMGILLKQRAHVNAITNQRRLTPLHLASQRHHVEVVRMLLDAGADVNRADAQHQTPLLHACIQGHAGVAQLLLSHGACVNDCTPSGETPLLFAAGDMIPDPALVTRLLHAGARTTCTNQHGETPLHALLRNRGVRRLKTMELLLNCDCDLDAKTKLGQTPLHLAVLERDPAAVARLISAGCAVECKDELGLTPLFYAVRSSNCEIAAVLFAGGARVHHSDWVGHQELMAGTGDPALLLRLIEEGNKCPTLAQMCRKAFRNHYGPQAHMLIGRLRIPALLKRYLSFGTL